MTCKNNEHTVNLNNIDSDAVEINGYCEECNATFNMTIEWQINEEE